MPAPKQSRLASAPPRAADERPLAIRRRPDLVVSPQKFRGRAWYVIKDPVAARYFYLTAEEYAILNSLDGVCSLAEIQTRFAREFAPRQVSASQLHRFLGELHRRGLVLSDSAGQGAELVARQGEGAGGGPLRWAERLLAIRFRGIHPQPLLDWLGPRASWLLGWPGWMLWGLLLAATALLLVAASSDLVRRAPSARDFLTPANLAWLAIALIVVKTLHELGHALAAWRQGCHVPEIGLQLFFFLPCLYTNVSDSWLLANKWRRMTIAAAGIYVELALAAVALFVWWAAEPGALASISYSVMLVASAGTLVLNANPLMRYDGYYLLSDLIEVPNLEQRSRQHLVAWLSEVALGTGRQALDPLDQERRPLLAGYAAAAIAYRVLLLCGLYAALRGFLQPWRLEPVSDVLLVLALLGLIVPLLSQVRQLVIEAQRRREFRPQRLLVTAGVAGLLLSAALFVPLPQRITAPAVLEARRARPVYISVAGTLREAASPGTQVRQGDLLARLESPELSRDLARLENERRAQALLLAHLETAQSLESAGSASLLAARETLADLDKRIGQVKALTAQLTLTAPCDGQILPSPPIVRPTDAGKLGGWTGTPLDRENAGCFLETGTHLCTIAPAAAPSSTAAEARVDAIAIVPQNKVTLIQPGASVRVVLPNTGARAHFGRIDDISQLEDVELPPHLVATHQLPARFDEAGKPLPLGAMYRVRIELDRDPAAATAGQVVHVAMAGRFEPLAIRFWRWLGATFRFGAAK